jgi:MFS family permease
VFLIGLQAIGVNLGAIIAGFFADFSGRRITLALSLTLYGISAVLGGMFTTNETLSFMYFINGTSWGILFVLYFFVIIGDLANSENCAKMYSLGLVTYFSSVAIGLIYQGFLSSIISSLLTCLLIFLSIIPVLLSPELISSDFIKRIKLKRHTNAIKKLNKN